MLDYFSPEIWTWVILPLIIFFARICDVTIGTLRLIFISRSMKKIASLLGFFEVIIWLAAIGQIMQNLNNWMSYLAYGAGFAAGNYIGISIAERLSIGKVLIRVITSKSAAELEKELRKNNFGITLVKAEGITGKVDIIFTVIRKENLRKVVDIIKKFNPNAFYSVEEVKDVSEGIFPEKEPWLERRLRLLPFRGSK
ncbi:MAG: DUF2179 domain-containing protein [Candidatus Muirbacterium halophilum]|nr:DUF2179 domain-containing protein [Candidatus Muirbacterium halophilum]MCK9475225.1 DUF2179 domain-containing protein [Candidatus Muirbacterium halophilum]